MIAWLKDQFGQKIYKLALDGGMTCPNRDGTLGTGGCIFCSHGGSGDFAEPAHTSVTEQIEAAKARVANKIKDGKYVAYFQSYTNTYAPVSYLEPLFSEAIAHPDVAALSIGTRPDCLPPDVLELLARQIRAHLASIGHPIAGDPKYGDPRVNEEVKKRFGVRSQMLHAWRLVMPETISGPLSYLAGKEFTAPMPAEMKRMEEMMKSAPKRPANHRP